MKAWRITAFLVCANFLGALAGGGIIAKGLNAMSGVPGFTIDSMLAYLVGTLFSLVGILFLKQYILRLGGWLSLGGAVLCVALIGLFHEAMARESLALCWIAYFGLCFFFTLVFVPRTFRADLSTKLGGQLSWVELAYSLGGLAGLYVWRLFPTAGFSHALAFSAGCLLIATVLDFATRTSLTSNDAQSKMAAQTLSAPSASAIEPLLAIGAFMLAIVVLTLTTQIIPQRLSVVLNNTNPYIAFSIGVFIAPLVIKSLGLSISHPAGWLRKGFITSFGRTLKVPAFSVPIVALVLTYLGVHAYATGQMDSQAGFVFVLAAALLYELFAILGFEAIGQMSLKTGRVALTFGIMGVVSTAFYLCLSLTHATVPTILTVEGILSLGFVFVFVTSALFSRHNR